MAKLDFKIDSQLLERLQSGGIAVTDFVNTVIHAPAQKQQVLAQLVTYHNNSGSAPQIDEFKVVNVDYNETSKTGKVKIGYSINRFYGCSDLSTSEQDHENWPFKIDTENPKLIIEAPDFETLSPNEEF